MKNFELDPGQWSTLRRLLGSALDLPAGERATWLENLRGADETFKPRLRALLEHADDSNRSPLDALPRVETAQFLERAHGASWPQVGEVIGPYRLVRHLSEGGMGSVWLGERVDGLVRRPVALKFPRLNTDRHGLSERLARERDFLAALDHPNIARLYDAGVTDDGRPFLALEYVEGERIDRYCALLGLDTRARVRLFVQVAAAVAHAHAKLIIHRDLKPANILVGADGQVRLLDFGIAKLIEDGSAGATELTQVGGRALTPEYASPEQVAGQPLSVAADVYSLGVVLYELLTGRRPYRPQRDTPAALEEEILRADVPLPSTVAADAAVRKALRGDLDTIVCKALKKQPEARYPTVNALADDLQRFLENRAVVARPDSAWYRARKFLVRNRVAVGVAAGAFVAIGAVAVMALWQAQRATREQLRAEHVKAFIASVIADADPYADAQAPTTTVLGLLNRAHERVTRELADQPDVRAELLRLLGKSYAGLFDLRSAERVLTQALAETKALAPGAANTLAAGETAVVLGEVKKQLGKADEARALVAEALAAARPDPVDVRASDLYADAKSLEAGLALRDGDYPAVVAAAEEAIRASTQVHGEVNPRAAFAYGLIPKTRGTGAAHQQRALEAAQKSYDLFRRLYPGPGRPHPNVIEAEHDYGVALLGAGDLTHAEEHVAQSLADAKALYGEASIMAGDFGARLGQIHLLRGEFERGLREVRAANEVLAKIDTSATIATAGRLRTQALASLWLQRPADAIAPLQQAIAILAGRKDTRATLIARADYALALIESGRQREAGELLAKIDAEGSALQPPERPLRAMARLELARGNAAAAKPLLLRALEISEADPRNPFRVDTLIDLARAMFALREFDAAAERARAALRELDRTAVVVTPHHAAAWSLLGRIDLEQGAAADAIPSLERADRIWQGLAHAGRWARDNAGALARAYRTVGRNAEADQVARRAGAARVSQARPD